MRRAAVSRHQAEFVGFGIRVISFAIPPIWPIHADQGWTNHALAMHNYILKNIFKKVCNHRRGEPKTAVAVSLGFDLDAPRLVLMVVDVARTQDKSKIMGRLLHIFSQFVLQAKMHSKLCERVATVAQFE